MSHKKADHWHRNWEAAGPILESRIQSAFTGSRRVTVDTLFNSSTPLGPRPLRLPRQPSLLSVVAFMASEEGAERWIGSVMTRVFRVAGGGRNALFVDSARLERGHVVGAGR